MDRLFLKITSNTCKTRVLGYMPSNSSGRVARLCHRHVESSRIWTNSRSLKLKVLELTASCMYLSTVNVDKVFKLPINLWRYMDSRHFNFVSQIYTMKHVIPLEYSLHSMHASSRHYHKRSSPSEYGFDHYIQIAPWDDTLDCYILIFLSWQITIATIDIRACMLSECSLWRRVFYILLKHGQILKYFAFTTRMAIWWADTHPFYCGACIQNALEMELPCFGLIISMKTTLKIWIFRFYSLITFVQKCK